MAISVIQVPLFDKHFVSQARDNSHGYKLQSSLAAQ